MFSGFIQSVADTRLLNATSCRWKKCSATCGSGPHGTVQSRNEAWYEFHLVLARATIALLFHPRVGTRFYRERNEELGLDDWTALGILPSHRRRFLFHIQRFDCPPEPQPVVEVSSEEEVPSPWNSAETVVEVSDYEVD